MLLFVCLWKGLSRIFQHGSDKQNGLLPTGDKPSSVPMMANLIDIYVSLCVNQIYNNYKHQLQNIFKGPWNQLFNTCYRNYQRSEAYWHHMALLNMVSTDWYGAWQHQAITWTNVVYAQYMRAISLEIAQSLKLSRN